MDKAKTSGWGIVKITSKKEKENRYPLYANTWELPIVSEIPSVGAAEMAQVVKC